MVVMQQLQPQPTTVPVGNVCSTQCKFHYLTLFTIHRTKSAFWDFLFFFFFSFLLMSPEIPSLAGM